MKSKRPTLAQLASLQGRLDTAEALRKSGLDRELALRAEVRKAQLERYDAEQALRALRAQVADERASRVDVDRTLANQDTITKAARELVQQVTKLHQQVFDALTKLQRWL